MHRGPPGWWLCSGLTTHSCKISSVTEIPTWNLKDNLALWEDRSSAGDKKKLWGDRIFLETHELMAVISTRTTIALGTWNIRAMFEAGKTAQVAAKMTNYNLTVLGIGETRWTCSGQTRLATGELLLYSGKKEEGNAPHTQGVALMLSKTAQSNAPHTQGVALMLSKTAQSNAPHTQGVALMLFKTAQRHSLNGRHTDQGFSRPPARPRNGRSAWMLSSVTPQQMTVMRIWKKSSTAGQTVYCHSALPKMKHYHRDGRLQC